MPFLIANQRDIAEAKAEVQRIQVYTLSHLHIEIEILVWTGIETLVFDCLFHNGIPRPPNRKQGWQVEQS
jgi:hypothetical protein